MLQEGQASLPCPQLMLEERRTAAACACKFGSVPALGILASGAGVNVSH